MQEKAASPLNQERLTQVLKRARFELTSVQHQLETLTDFIKSKGDLNSDFVDLLLQVHEKQIIIEENLSHFSGDTPVENSDVNRLRDLVTELESLKDDVLVAAGQLGQFGYDVNVEIRSSKGKETPKMKAARAEKELDDLEAIYKEEFTHSPYRHLTFKQARTALEAINENNERETDHGTRTIKNRIYYRTFAEKIREIKDFLRARNVSVPGDGDTTDLEGLGSASASVDEPKSPDIPSDNPDSAGADKVSPQNPESDPKIEDLYHRYLKLDRSVFKQNHDDENSPFKRWDLVRKEIEDVLIFAKVDPDIRDEFLDKRIVSFYHGKISEAQKVKRGTMSNIEFKRQLSKLQEEVRQKVSQLYTEMLFEVALQLRRAQPGTDTLEVTDPRAPATEIDRQLNPVAQAFREELSEKRSEYLEKNEEYKKALEEFYKGEREKREGRWLGGFYRGGDYVRDLFGFAPAKLPTELQELKEQNTALRLGYARALDTALKARSAVVPGNKAYSLEADQAKIAFSKRFIIKPGREVLELQKAQLAPEKQAAFGRIFGGLSKFATTKKWYIRAGVITFSGLAGLATGGVGAMAAGAGLKGLQMVGVISGSALAAGKTNAWMNARADKAEELLKDEEANATKTKSSFSLEADNFSEGESAFMKEVRMAEAKKKQVGAATVAAGVATGGVLGFGAGTANAWGMDELPDTNSDVLAKQNIELTPANEVPAENPEGTAAESQIDIGATTLDSDESVPEAENSNGFPIDTDKTTEAAIENSESIVSGTEFKLDNSDMQVNDYRVSSTFGHDGEKLSDAAYKEIDDFVQKAVVNAHNDSMRFNVDHLERELPARLSEKFGGENWWPEMGVVVDLQVDEFRTTNLTDAISADSMEEVEVEKPVDSITVDGMEGRVTDNLTDAISADSMEENETGMPVVALSADGAMEANENVYVVQRGDTLSEIVNEHFREELQKAPPGEYNRVLYQVLDNIEASAELKNSLGMKSGDIDLIYPNETLDLTAIGDEIQKVLDGKDDVTTNEQFEPPIESDLPETKSSAADVSPEEHEAEKVTETPRVTPIAETITPTVLPENKIVDGDYFNSPEWKSYINQHFGSEAKFNKILLAEVDSIDQASYGWIDKWLGGYESAYKAMQDMSVYDLEYLMNSSNVHVKNFCDANNIEFSPYLNWQRLVENLKYEYPHTEDTTLADLFKRHVAETKSPLLEKLNT